MFHLFWIVGTIALGFYAAFEANYFLLPYIEHQALRMIACIAIGGGTYWTIYVLGFRIFHPLIRSLSNPINPIQRQFDGFAARLLLFSLVALMTGLQMYLFLPIILMVTAAFWSSSNTFPLFIFIQEIFSIPAWIFFIGSGVFALALIGDYFGNQTMHPKDWRGLVFGYTPIFLFFIFSFMGIDRSGGAATEESVILMPVTVLFDGKFDLSFLYLAYLAIPIFVLSAHPAAFSVIIGYWLFLSFFRTIHEPGWFFKVAKKTTRLRDHFRRAAFGLGGSSSFAGFWKEWEFPYYKSALLLGKSLYGNLFIGLDDDRHFVTIAGSRGGKGISYIIPNLLLWSDNIICLDPKGSNTEVTARKRADHHKQGVHVIDPYSKTSVRNLHRRYNPLQEIDIYSPDCVKQIDIITSALIVSSGDKNRYWDEAAEKVIKGFIAHVLTDPTFEGNRSLVAVYKALHQPAEAFKAILQTMAQNPGCNGLARESAAILSNASGEHRGSLLGTVSTHIKFLEDPRVQDLLGGESDFSMFDLPSKPVSIYLVLEGNDLQRLNRFVRLFILLAFYAMENPKGGRANRSRKTLFILDEFYSLGHMPILEKAAGYVAGIGVKLWPILQNIGQLQDLYGKNWETFMENAAAVQVFSLAGQGTKDYVMQKLGNTRSMVDDVSQMAYEKKWGQNANYRTSSSYQIRPLLDPSELEKEFARSREFGLIFPTGEDPFVVKRVPYFQLFDKSMYDPDPDFTGPAAKPLHYGWTTTNYFGSNSPILLKAAEKHAAKPLIGELLDAPGPRLDIPVEALPPLPFDLPAAITFPELQLLPLVTAATVPIQEDEPVTNDAEAYQDALDLMGLSESFTVQELRKKYAGLIDTVHGDVLPDLEQAYYILKDPKMIQAHQSTNTRTQDLKALALPDPFTKEDLQTAFIENLNDLPAEELNAVYERLKLA
ncbi:MAG: type IV secretory system conjugative DNA transfer family protein [Nitrospirota bacterium]|nr:type IV secretory system conjugative DNA transfer family protein [Nitrospira sp.]MCA9479868.1 type IV secretory system conjugative DNA transfer family protein [Nitrospira sp.]MDH5457084.1 type IV secretory system conjugative DNA transfer family protein [Nitrospinota bacterium]MDH5585175.1 type IV secretory system conjugative DNA transfer family protein [Nitrospirota bacterium]MDH5773426.1 type IV secretory system conjugative DNA transfer family protein [Nitrospirota bacterium]